MRAFLLPIHGEDEAKVASDLVDMIRDAVDDEGEPAPQVIALQFPVAGGAADRRPALLIPNPGRFFVGVEVLGEWMADEDQNYTCRAEWTAVCGLADRLRKIGGGA